MNRGTVKTESIADKLSKAKKDISDIKKQNNAEKLDAKVFVNGRLNRKDNAYTPKNFSLLTSLANQISDTCKGVDLAVINYLIHEGLNVVKNRDDLGIIEYSSIEEKYK